MLTCSFLCDDPIVDEDFYPKLQSAIDNLVSMHDEIEFLLFHTYRNCTVSALCAILEAKQAYLNKRILLTLVASNAIMEQLAQTSEIFVPVCAFDRVLLLPVEDKNGQNYRTAPRVAQEWMIDRSDYLFFYLYEDFLTNRQLYRYARRAKNIKIIDLTSRATARFIKNSISNLSVNEQYIKKQVDNGITYRMLGKKYGITDSAIGLKVRKIAHKLSYYAAYRFYQQIGRNTALPSIVCCLLDFHSKEPLRADKIRAVKQAVSFLTCNVEQCLFIVAQSMCRSVMITAVRQAIQENLRTHKAHISVAALYYNRPQEWNEMK